MFINVLLGIVVICIVFFVIVFMLARKDMNKTDSQYILSYIKENAQKNTCALIIKKMVKFYVLLMKIRGYR